MYDWLIGKLVEVPIIVFQIFSLVQVANEATSSWSEFVVVTTKEPKLIRGKTKLAIIFYTLPLPIEPMEVLVVVVNIQV
jgi:hypothetical protein